MDRIRTFLRQFWCGLFGHGRLQATENGTVRCLGCGYERPGETHSTFSLNMVYKASEPLTDPLELAKLIFHEGYHNDEYRIDDPAALALAIETFVQQQPADVHDELRRWIGGYLGDASDGWAAFNDDGTLDDIDEAQRVAAWAAREGRDV